MAVGMDGETRARYLVKRLLEKHRDLPIVVGLWGTPDVGTAVARPWGGPVDVATSFAQARENLHRLSNQALAEARPRAESVMVPQ
jgi:hypothetical protein